MSALAAGTDEPKMPLGETFGGTVGAIVGSPDSAIFASVAVFLFAGVLFATIFARRTAEREAALFALLCFALAEHGVGELVREHLDRTTSIEAGETIQLAGLIAAFALVVHFAVVFSRRPGRRTVRAAYAAFAILETVAIGHYLLSPPPSVHTTAALAAAHPFALVPVVYAAALLASVSALGSAVRTYLEGRREAVGVVLGASALLATTINDLGVASGLFGRSYFGDFGFLAFVVGTSPVLSIRYAKALGALERRAADIRQKVRELAVLREDLAVVEAELGRKEQLAVVGELAAVIAHEVRNPLAIMGNAVAGLRKPSISRDDHVTLLTILDEETTRLNRLVTDLLRYARPVNVQRTAISLNEFIEKSLALLKTRKNVTTVFTPAEHEGRVWADGNLLRQVFDNLFDNAVQAMGVGGTLTVRIRTATEDGIEGFAVDILDTGEGMDTLVRARAKDPFFTTRPSGTGLGLAIVDRIVDAHGGRFVLDSRAGEGTTVTVFLPYGSSSEPPPRSKSSGRRANSEPPSGTPSSRRPRTIPPRREPT